jgi:peptidyl-prolyl cis-trans isomerase C
MPTKSVLGALGIAAALLVPLAPAVAQDKVLANINGKALTEADVRFAEEEIGAELGSLPPETRKRVLVEFLIEHMLMAEQAEAQKMGQGSAFDQRMGYWRRKALRDAYFETAVKGAIKEADAKTFYDERVKAIKPEEEVRAKHILVETKEKAEELAGLLKKGGDFDALAKEHSKDPGSKATGGDLGYFTKGQMVPQFEEAAFTLKQGEVSAPVQSQFGWHLIRLEDKRNKPAPTFDSLKDRILGSMLHQKAQATVADLRAKAKIEYIDADIKKAIEEEQKQQSAQPPVQTAPPAAAGQSKPAEGAKK